MSIAPSIEERVTRLEEEGTSVDRRNSRDIRELKVLGNDLLRDINDLGLALEKTEDRLGAKIDALDTKIDGVEKRLEAKIDALDTKIDGVEKRLEAKIDALDIKIDGVAHNLDTKINFLAQSSALILAHLGIKVPES